MDIRNAAGEIVQSVGSDAEAAEWWLVYGRAGDRLGDEPLSEVVEGVFPDAEWHIDSRGCVVRR
jgi:hypothetical protein